MNAIYNIFTRMFDIVFSLGAILVLTPIFIPVMVVLSLTGENQVFYLQKRVGRDKKFFHVIKFATMLKDSPNLGAGAITLRRDPRVLPFGRMLRSTKINELPQLLNVLLGDMSLVGPRPLMIKQFGFYDENSQNIISQMRPGLTGIGSILFRDEEKYFENDQNPDLVYQNKIAPAKSIVEKWYFDNKSASLYLKLIFLTVVAVGLPKLDLSAVLDPATRKEFRDVLQ